MRLSAQAGFCREHHPSIDRRVPSSRLHCRSSRACAISDTMRRRISSFIACLLLIAVAPMASGAGPGIQESQLGKVEFPTSGSDHAQSHFLRGVAAVHSFWYEEALEAFRAATKADPDFMMGYWGEAMAHNHPIWREQDTEAARAVLTKIRDTAKLTPRERAYLNAVTVLYGKGDKVARDTAYAAAMEKLYRDSPEDLEAACFYALSLLAVDGQSPNPLRTRIQAGVLALDVFRKNPDHPCAAHYTIHAFDDPDHAILALPAARRYARIAPESHHALHMPAHIFLQLGMWPEAAASNEAGWPASVAWVKRQGLSLSHRDYHSLYWLMYVYLQQGRYSRPQSCWRSSRRTWRRPAATTRRGRPSATRVRSAAISTRWSPAMSWKQSGGRRRGSSSKRLDRPRTAKRAPFPYTLAAWSRLKKDCQRPRPASPSCEPSASRKRMRASPAEQNRMRLASSRWPPWPAPRKVPMTRRLP